MSAETHVAHLTASPRAEPNPDMPALQRVLIDRVLRAERAQVLLARDSGLSAKHVNQLLLGRAEGSLSAWTALLLAAGVDLNSVLPPASTEDGA